MYIGHDGREYEDAEMDNMLEERSNMTTQLEPTPMNLLLALFLSSKRAAHRQVILPQFGYELTVTLHSNEYVTLTVALWEKREDGLPDDPHHVKELPSLDDLLEYLDEWGVPHESWYPVEDVGEEGKSHANTHL